MTTRIVYFTAGTVGAGHLMRALAIRRGLARGGVDATLHVLTPPTAFTRLVGDATTVAVEPQRLADPSAAPETALARALADLAPDLLIVDMFWAPLRFVLPALRVPSWLLLRQAPAAWLAGPPGVPFARAEFDRVLGIEPGLPFDAEPIPPIVAVDPDELLAPADAHARLGTPPGATVRLVVHAGLAGEVDAMRARTEAAASPGEVVHVADLFATDAPFPVATCFHAAAFLHGGAGYNFFWETRWLGRALTSDLVPLPRNIDRQGERVRAARDYDMAANGADVLGRMLS